MTTAEQVARHLKFDKTLPGLISYSLIDNANGDEWKEIKLVFNGSGKPQEVRIPRGEWKVIAEDGRIKADGLGSSKGGKIIVPATSALILAKEK